MSLNSPLPCGSAPQGRCGRCGMLLVRKRPRICRYSCAQQPPCLERAAPRHSGVPLFLLCKQADAWSCLESAAPHHTAGRCPAPAALAPAPVAEADLLAPHPAPAAAAAALTRAWLSAELIDTVANVLEQWPVYLCPSQAQCPSVCSPLCSPAHRSSVAPARHVKVMGFSKRILEDL